MDNKRQINIVGGHIDSSIDKVGGHGANKPGQELVVEKSEHLKIMDDGFFR